MTSVIHILLICHVRGAQLHLVWAADNKSQKDVYWSKVDRLVPIMQAIAGVKIWVNDVELTSDRPCIQFGRLHTGDITTLTGPRESRTHLWLWCEFFYGFAVQPRRAAFAVEELSFGWPVFRRIIINFSYWSFPVLECLFLWPVQCFSQCLFCLSAYPSM